MKILNCIRFGWGITWEFLFNPRTEGIFPVIIITALLVMAAVMYWM